MNEMIEVMTEAISKVLSPVEPRSVARACAAKALDALDAHGNFKSWIETSAAVIGCPDASLEERVSDLRDAMPTDQFQAAFK